MTLWTSKSYDFDSTVYMQNWGARHVGVDIECAEGTPIYPIAFGQVVKVVRGTDPMLMVVIIQHKSTEGPFFAVYGHVYADPDINVGKDVDTTKKLGIVKKAGSPSHLHFGINVSANVNQFIYGKYGWGRIPKESNPREVGWEDPIGYLCRHRAISKAKSADFFSSYQPANLKTRENYKTILCTTNVQGIAFSPDEAFLAFGAGNFVYIYKTDDWTPLKIISIGSKVNDLKFSPNGKWLAVAAGNSVRVFNSRWEELPISPLLASAICLTVAFSRDSRLLFFGTSWQDAHIYVYETEHWHQVAKFGASMDKNSIAISLDNKYISITSSYKYYPSIWTTQSWERKIILQGGYGEYDHNTYWYGVQFSPDGKFLCYGFVDQVKHEYSIFLHLVGGNWPIINKVTWQCKNCGPGNIAYSPDGKLLAHGADGVRIFKVEQFRLVQIWVYSTHQPLPQHSLAFSPKGTWLAYADGAAVNIYKVEAIPTGICLNNICLTAPYWAVFIVATLITVAQLLQFVIK